jgi:hypothetical protein
VDRDAAVAVQVALKREHHNTRIAHACERYLGTVLVVQARVLHQVIEQDGDPVALGGLHEQIRGLLHVDDGDDAAIYRWGLGTG